MKSIRLCFCDKKEPGGSAVMRIRAPLVSSLHFLCLLLSLSSLPSLLIKRSNKRFRIDLQLQIFQCVFGRCETDRGLSLCPVTKAAKHSLLNESLELVIVEAVKREEEE